MTFNREIFDAHITSQPLRRSLLTFDTVTSTNTVLLQEVNAKAAIGSIAIAATQTAGRGQRGNTWLSPLGGLYLSIAIAPNLPAEKSARLTMASAWGIARQLHRHQIPVKLKWPNDLFLQGKKLGGILTETSIQHSIIHRAIVGVGINWTNETPETAISLNHPSIAMTPPISSLEQLAAIVVNGIEHGQRSLQAVEMQEIIPDYRQWLYQPLPQEFSWENL